MTGLLMDPQEDLRTIPSSPTIASSLPAQAGEGPTPFHPPRSQHDAQRVGSPEPTASRMPRAKRHAEWWSPVAALAGVIAVWAIAALIVPPLLLPAPWAVGERLIAQLRSGITAQYLWPTVLPALGGLAAAIIVSFLLAIAVVRSRVLSRVMEPWIALSQTVPLVAIAPVLVLWMGYGAVPIAVLCAIIAFFPMVTTMIVALRGVDRTVREHAQLDGASALQMLAHVDVPIALPGILAGVRSGAVLAMTGAVVGEMVMGGRGLGTLLTLSRQASDTIGVFTVIVWISLVAMVLYAVATVAMRRAAAAL